MADLRPTPTTSTEAGTGSTGGATARRSRLRVTAAPSRHRRWWLAGLIISAGVVILAAAFASPDPDGLERVAEDYGFIGRATEAFYRLVPDYALPGVGDPLLATVGAGLLGLAVVGLAVVGLGLLLRRRSA